MVKLIVKDDKLYMMQAGREIELESATIQHNDKYEFTVFIRDGNHITRKEIKQVTFKKPLVIFKPSSNYNGLNHVLFYAKSPTGAWYINLYEKPENVKLY